MSKNDKTTSEHNTQDKLTLRDLKRDNMKKKEIDPNSSVPPLGEILRPVGWIQRKAKNTAQRIENQTHIAEKVGNLTVTSAAATTGGAAGAAITTIATGEPVGHTLFAAAAGAVAGKVSEKFTRRKAKQQLDGKDVSHAGRIELERSADKEHGHSKS